MILAFVSGGVVGAVVFYLVLRNNPKLAKKVAGVVDKIDEKI